MSERKTRLLSMSVILSKLERISSRTQLCVQPTLPKASANIHTHKEALCEYTEPSLSVTNS